MIEQLITRIHRDTGILTEIQSGRVGAETATVIAGVSSDWVHKASALLAKNVA